MLGGGTTRAGGVGLLVVLQAVHVALHAHQATAEQTQCPNTTVTSPGQVVGAGTLKMMAAQSADICCGHCVDAGACVAYTFEVQTSMCFLKDNVAHCGLKQGATSGVLANRTAKQGGACAKDGEKRTGYKWPPSSYGSLWVLLALLVLVIVGGGLLFVRSEKRRHDSSFLFPAEQVWHAACFSERSHLPEVVLLAYRLLVLLWAMYILVDSYTNNAFCTLSTVSFPPWMQPSVTANGSNALLHYHGVCQSILSGTSSCCCATLLSQVAIRCGV